MGGSATKGLAVNGTSESKAVGGVTKWPFQMGGGNVQETWVRPGLSDV